MNNRNRSTRNKISNPEFSRRRFLQRSVQLCSAVFGMGLLSSSCGRKEESPAQSAGNAAQSGFGDNCDDLSNTSQSEIDKRDVYGYVEETPYPENRCDNCSLYIPPSGDEGCGGCVLFEGPVFAEGYCDYWAPEA